MMLADGIRFLTYAGEYLRLPLNSTSQPNERDLAQGTPTTGVTCRSTNDLWNSYFSEGTLDVSSPSVLDRNDG